MKAGRPQLWTALSIGLLIVGLWVGPALAHAIGGTDADFVKATNRPDPFPFMYLGGKHMVTGYDHLLFLVGVIFFLHRFRDIALYVTLFSLGHSATLLLGVLLKLHVDAHFVDAAIGLSVVWKAFDNLGGFKSTFGWQPDNRYIVAGFGLVHGFGLATKLQALDLNPNGLATNLISFNIGVEIGQICALTVILAAMTLWRKTRLFAPTAAGANVLIMLAGFVLTIDQLARYALGAP